MILQCAYARTGFQHFALCRGAYHASCIKVGPPFRSRRSNNDGLAFPPVHHWGCFICEACTVRAVTGRELLPSDCYLMCLERVRLLDIAWSWARGTHRTYQTQFNFIQKFEADFTVSVLASSFPLAPPSSPDIALAWRMEHCALHQVRALSRGCCPAPVSYSTVRQL